jgi:hypothetical protein
MQLGCSIPVADIGTGPSVLRDYAQAAEGLGYAVASARLQTPITTRSCCSDFCPAALGKSALPWAC